MQNTNPARVALLSIPSIVSTRFILAALAILTVPAAHANDGDFLGVSQLDHRMYDEARDAAGNQYATFRFYGQTDADPGPGVLELQSLDGEYSSECGYLRKLDPAGNLLWVRQIRRVETVRLAVDAQGNAYVLAESADNIVADNGEEVTEIYRGGQYVYAALLKYSPDGDLLWHRRYAAPSRFGSRRVEPGHVRVDANGNIALAGHFDEAIDVNPGGEEQLLQREDTLEQGFVLRLSPQGVLLQAHKLWTTQGYLEMTADGGFLTVGGFGEFPGDIDPGPAVVTAGSRSYFARYDAQSNLVWVRKFESQYLYFEFISQDSAGNILLTGSALANPGIEIDLDPGPGVELLSPGYAPGIHAFIAKYSPSGEFIWQSSISTASFAGTGNGAIARIAATDADGAIYFTGEFNHPITVGSGRTLQTLTPAGDFDNFLAKYASNGDFLWIKQIGGDDRDRMYRIYLFPGEPLSLWGSFERGQVDVDPGVGENLLDEENGYVYNIRLEASDIPPLAGPHTADTNRDWSISLLELLRVVQFYNIGGYRCAAEDTPTEDGFEPGAAAGTGPLPCALHDADYNPEDATVDISELLRVIQLYSSTRYTECPVPGSEDGYCPDVS